MKTDSDTGEDMRAPQAAGLAEYARPWKLGTLALGIALLIIGSFYYQAPDWDIPISLIMATLAYLTAPWSPFGSSWSEGGGSGRQCCSLPGLRSTGVIGYIGTSRILSRSN